MSERKELDQLLTPTNKPKKPLPGSTHKAIGQWRIQGLTTRPKKAGGITLWRGKDENILEKGMIQGLPCCHTPLYS